MRILILGHKGFIGRNLVEYLESLKSFIGKFDYYRKGHDVPPRDRVIITKIDATDIELTRFINKQKIYAVVNCAYDRRNPVANNAKIITNILASNAKRIILLSSGAVYDKSKPIIRAKEDDMVLCKDKEYASVKYFQDTMGQKDKRVVILRLFGVYGKYEDYGKTFISNAICRTLVGCCIKIYQDCRFSYLYINDLTKIIRKFVFKKELKYQVYNIVPQESTLLTEIAGLIGEKATIVEKDGLNHEYTGSPLRLLQEFPKLKFTKLEKGVRELYAYYRGEINFTINRLKVLRNI